MGSAQSLSKEVIAKAMQQVPCTHDGTLHNSGAKRTASCPAGMHGEQVFQCRTGRWVQARSTCKKNVVRVDVIPVVTAPAMPVEVQPLPPPPSMRINTPKPIPIRMSAKDCPVGTTFYENVPSKKGTTQDMCMQNAERDYVLSLCKYWNNR